MWIYTLFGFECSDRVKKMTFYATRKCLAFQSSLLSENSFKRLQQYNDFIFFFFLLTVGILRTAVVVSVGLNAGLVWI